METRRWLFCYLGLLPILALFVVLRVIPIIQTFIYSVFNSSVVNPMQNFIGLDNFRRLPTDATFRTR